ncbi:MAG: radical SAM protein [Gammaproteobacteria bacterium]|nr:radical SAM protein [Gammaproteobacteria bacterium]
MKVYPVFIPHAGCPHQCYFCSQNRTNSQTDVPSDEDILKRLDDILPQKGQGEIAFYGGTFTLLPVDQQEAYLAAAEKFIANGRAKSIRVSTRPDAVDQHSLKCLCRCSVSTVELGCQSFSDIVLQQSGRGHGSADNIAAVELCKQQGLTVGVQLMPGLPGDLPETALLSCRQSLALGADFLRIYPTVVIAGTMLARMFQQGRYLPWSLQQSVDVCAEMLLLCRQALVPVIRIGLQQDPQLQANLLAGPYHPAFGQLVRSNLWRRLMQQAGELGQEFYVNPDDFSDAVGHRGDNRDWLAEDARGFVLSVDSSVKRGVLSVAGQELPLYNLPVRV